jgi:oxygen-independent coproporphyrinogen-3 oxidase
LPVSNVENAGRARPGFTLKSDNSLMQQKFILDQELLARHDRNGPRYTSYPTANQFTTDFNADDYRQAAARSNRAAAPLSLYFHIPFCNTVCFYCACNKVVTKDRSKAQPYLDRVYREIALQAGLFEAGRPVEQLHWGGGTPTFISEQQMRDLMRVTGEHFQLLDGDRGEYSIEIDPREESGTTLETLREIGFNRLSLGLQDLDPKVQKAVNRLQGAELTFGVLERARSLGFRSLSLDLIYGLPLQTVDSFASTLDQVIERRPDRLSVFNYAHLPERFKPQRRINAEELPCAQEKLDIMQMVGEKLGAAGYAYIGMDHFALPDDELARAQREHSLYRNFQGYSTHADCDLVAIGVTSIGLVDDTYSQNLSDLESYYARIDEGELPIARGIRLTRDDQVRRALITDLICHFELDRKAFAAQWDIDFAAYFADESAQLPVLARDGLLTLEGDLIRVTPAGRLLIRSICMLFDAYLKKPDGEQRFSKVI